MELKPRRLRASYKRLPFVNYEFTTSYISHGTVGSGGFAANFGRFLVSQIFIEHRIILQDQIATNYPLNRLEGLGYLRTNHCGIGLDEEETYSF